MLTHKKQTSLDMKLKGHLLWGIKICLDDDFFSCSQSETKELSLH